MINIRRNCVQIGSKITQLKETNTNMNKAFDENIDVKVNSAQIGISKTNWDAAEEQWTKAQAQEFMETHSYDLLPIENKNENFEYYWSTIDYGEFTEIKKLKIEEANTIYYLTDLPDLLAKFKESSNSSYFLTNHSNIIGLVSNVNLNSKPVYVYFYSLISKIEIEIGQWLKVLISEKEMIECINEKFKNPEDGLSSGSLKRFNDDRKANTNNHFVEYLYFTQLQYIIKRKKLTSIFGYDSNTKFDGDFGIISQYRNWIAHPLNSSKVDLSKDLFKLHNSLERIIENLESNSIDLISAYYQTTYITLKTSKTPKFSIEIGKTNIYLNDFLKTKNMKTWVFITAENPNSTKLSTEENANRNSSLEKILVKNKYKFLNGEGIPNNNDWTPENSYLVFNLELNKAKEICSEFKQNAFVFGKVDEISELILMT